MHSILSANTMAPPIHHEAYFFPTNLLRQ